jgi:phosphatidylethanolamine/phosphatidyl-N-methylethanolamine N-methyltransferase
LISLLQADDSGQNGGVLASSDAAHRALSGTDVENEFVREVYADISSWYDYFFGPTLHAGRLEAMPRLPITPGDSVLEVGVGTGINALLYPKHCHVTGIDFSSSMLKKATRRLAHHNVTNVELLKMDAADLEFDDESFDLVYAPYVISVVPDPVRVVREMHRVCRVGGHVVVLNHFLSENRLLSRAERLISPLTVHIGFKADVDLPGFIAQSGFEPLSIERVKFSHISLGYRYLVPKLWSLVTFQKNRSDA